MKMKYESLPGIYELESISSNQNGRPVTEIVQPSMFTFTRNGRLSVVCISDFTVMAYVGSYEVKDDVLKISVDSSMYREMEGTVITRKILKFDGGKLVLEAIGSKSGDRSILTWNRAIAL
jgi:hypothetical protein